MSSRFFRFLERLRPRKRSQIRRDIEEEIEFHLRMRSAELEREGLSPPAAREEALRRFGDVDSTLAACTEADLDGQNERRTREYRTDLLQDIRFGVTQIRRSPVFALGAIVTLGISLGAATTVFTAVDRILFRPLPYRNAERVVTIWELDPKHRERTEVSPGNYLDWRERSTAFQTMALAEPSGFDFTWREGPPTPVSAWRVTREFPSVLGIEPMLGRGFLPEDFESGASQAVLVSHRFWRRRLRSNPNIVGRTIRLDEMPAVVRGVLPDWARYPGARDLWAPKVFRPGEARDRTSSYMHAVALLRPGVALESARSDLDRVLQTADQEDSEPGSKRAELVSLREQIQGPVRLPLLTLFGAVALLVAAACSNVAGLLLTRAADRRSEFGVRVALGASPPRILRQVLTEGAILTVLGGVLGIALAQAGMRVLVALGPAALSDLGPPAIDLRVLGFGILGVAIATALSSLAPAIRAARDEPLASLSTGRGSDSASRAESSLRSALVMAQVSLAVVLLIGAGLLLRSFLHLRSTELGFRTEDRVSMQVFLWDRNPSSGERLQRVRQITERFRGIPDVQDVAVVSALPFHPHQIDSRGRLTIDGMPGVPADEGSTVTTIVASPSYHPLMGIPTKRGRTFDSGDHADAPLVAIINETLARRFFPGADPVGSRVHVGVMGPPAVREIVGVVGDVRPVDVHSPPRSELYIPYEQSATGSVTFVVRSRRGALVIPALRNALFEIDPGQSVYYEAPLQELVSATLAERRFHLILLIAFSVVTLLLAALGTYSLVSYATHRRTREIGIRVALGASRRDVVIMILRQGLRPVFLGLMVGVAGAMVATQLLRHMLYEVSPFDPATIAGVSIALALAAGLAAYVPARKASHQPPAAAIQFE